MYTRCHICNGRFGDNQAILHLPVGRKLAFDVERGRLWVVCGRCGEWNLTPLEDRWEAIQECEQQFATAGARASAGKVGFARSNGVELIRLGDALHDEIANWRYGHRFARRRRRVRLLRGVVAVAGALMVAAFAWFGLTYGTAAVATHLALIGVVYAAYLARTVKPRGSVTFVDTQGDRLRMPRYLVSLAEFVRTGSKSQRETIGVGLHLDKPQHRWRKGSRMRMEVDAPDREYHEESALPVLRALLPRLNWDGASEDAVRAAVAIVDRAEDAARSSGSRLDPEPPWRRIAKRQGAHRKPLAAMPPTERLALEMAVTEEFERRELSRQASTLHPMAARASEVAAIADDLFLPARITDWIARRRRNRERP